MGVSVVVPTYRRPELLGRCLEALGRQEFDPSVFEILVADDADSEATRAQVEAFATTCPARVRYLPVRGGGRIAEPGGQSPRTLTRPLRGHLRDSQVSGGHGPAAARNIGWRAAEGEIIAFTDDDCVPDPRWLAEGLAAFGGTVAAVSGRVVVPLPDAPTDYERNEAGLESAEFVTANCLVRREALEAVGGFDERFRMAWREDSDLQFALLGRGFRILKAPEARVLHPVRPAPWGISLKQQRKGRFNALLFKKHPELYRQRIRSAPPWDYYASVVLLAMAIVSALAGQALPALLALIGWAVLTARFCARRLHGNSRSPRHVAEMLVTSALIPPLSVFWRLRGAWTFRVPFL